MIEGVDYSTDRPDPHGLYEVGKRFAARYVGPGTSDKHLTIGEAQALAAAGVSIVAVAEGAEAGLLGGFGIGVDWAIMADSHAKACGMPASRPIYFAVDFDCTEAQWPRVADALDGAASVLGVNRVGVYGGIRVIEWAARDRVASWFWQTYAWSGGQWSDRAHVQQYRNNVSLVGGTVDLDRSYVNDYGQWKPGDAPEIVEDGMRMIRDAQTTGVYLLGPFDQATNKVIVYPIHDPSQFAAYLAAGIPSTDVDGVDWNWYEPAEGPPAAVVDLGPVLTAIAALGDTPMVDAVAVAAAIAARPEIARTLSESVARQLATITGSLTLSGSLSAGIKPPQD